MQEKHFIFTVAALVLALSAIGPSAIKAQTISGLSLPPVDTADAQRVRIWFPRESAGNCRVTVDIADDSGVVIRHLANFLAAPGYYNFYWDKRDDSGYRVPPGVYQYRLNNCGEKKTGTLEARYSRWEKMIDFTPYDASNPGDLSLTITADSIPVSLVICNGRGRPMDSVFVDSVFDRGVYPIHIDPKTHRVRYGNYQLQFTAGDYTYIREVTFLP